MATLRLNQHRVDALKPRKAAYNVRDRDLKGFGVRVLPSGAKRYFMHSQHDCKRVWKIVGDAGAIGADEGRSRARTLLAAIRKGDDDSAAAPPDTPFETVADEVFTRYARNWKPSTLAVNRGYYRKQILPWFEGRPISEIAAHDVQLWFASLHETPVAADRSAPVLSVIMRQAEVYGYRPEGTNPCTGIKRYRRQGRERFLTTAEMRRLGEVLARHEANHPQVVAIIRLLLLTGCRKGEIVTLKWRDYREGNLFLRDSKTGPRTVWLSAAARAILDSLPRDAAWIFGTQPADDLRLVQSECHGRVSLRFELMTKVDEQAGVSPRPHPAHLLRASLHSRLPLARAPAEEALGLRTARRFARSRKPPSRRLSWRGGGTRD